MNIITDTRISKRLIDRMKKIENPDATPLMLTFMKIIEEDNRKGVLAGTDKDGGYMLAVKYRPKGPTVKIGAKSATRFRNNIRAGAIRGRFAGFGPHLAGANNNLLRREYEQLTGPPLAPRGRFSRVITNLKTGFESSPSLGRWKAIGFWDQVVDVKGRKFLDYHFWGVGRLPKRDLAGVRPEGRGKARFAAVAWMSDQIRAMKSFVNAA